MIIIDTKEITNNTVRSSEWNTSDLLCLLHVKRGITKIRTRKKDLLLKERDILFFFERSLYKIESTNEAEIEILKFSREELNIDESEYKKTVIPFLDKHLSSHLFFLITSSNGKAIESAFLGAYQSQKRKDQISSIITKESILKAFVIIYESALKKEFAKQKRQKCDSQIETMISFINKNYMKSLTLQEIANEASLSERACLRVFQNAIKDSPTQYLLKKRLDEGAKLIQENPSMPIKEISQAVGFSSPSYFTELFHRYYEKTPKEYLADINITKWSDNPFGALEEFFKN